MSNFTSSTNKDIPSEEIYFDASKEEKVKNAMEPLIQENQLRKILMVMVNTQYLQIMILSMIYMCGIVALKQPAITVPNCA